MEIFLQMKDSVFFLSAIACHDLSPLKSFHSRTNISRIFTGIFLYQFLPLSVFGNPTGTRNQTNHWFQKLLDRQFLLRYECYNFLKDSTMNNRISPWDLSIQIFFLTQTVSGFLGNLSLLRYYLSFFHSHCRLRDTDLILMHLTLANLLLILSKAMPKTIAALGYKNFIDDLGCHILLYVNRVARGVSISTTCLLSIYQITMISSMNSFWKDLRGRVPKYICCCTFACWILNMLINLIFPIYVSYVSGRWSNRELVKNIYLQYSSVDHETIIGSVYVTLVVFPEVLFSVLIIWSSGSAIFILCRHKQQVQNIHKTNPSPRSSAVSRATQNILLLLITFICFHTFSSLFAASLALQQNPEKWLVNITEVISLIFPNVSPFLLLKRDSSLRKILPSYIRTRKTLCLMRNM